MDIEHYSTQPTNYGVIIIPIEMLHDDSAGRDNAGTDQCQLPEYGLYNYVCKSIYLYTIIRAVRPSTCNVVRNAFGHLIRWAPY